MGEAVCERPNRLSKSRSRYLRMHACDPVDWHPWGEEAFRKALEEDKPLFLSTGYSSCHWCHVMQRESFQDEEVASVLNSFFVPVKVDREEMPDVDEIYMTAAIAVTGSGGWPLSVFLTPDLRPFYAGTYFPRDRFLEILGSIRDLWSRDRERILRAAQEIHRAVSDYLSPRAGGSPSASSFERVFEKAFTEISASFDPVFGGFGASMKFPMVPHHQFLLRYWYRRGDEAALRMVLRSVSSMARLGLHDHLLGGFFRYTVDRGWRIPHFEKMLYDNAQILGLLVDLYKATGAPEHLVLARKTSDFLVREMAGPEGLFYSSLDAEAGGVEGAPYLWSEAELEEALGKDLAEVAKKIYGWSPSALVGGRMHPVRAASPRDLARILGISFEEAARLYEEAEARLVGYRLSKKPRPGADDKYLADWNSLAARAFARLYTVSGDPGHLAAARRIVGFLWERMWLGDRMAHVFSGGEASGWGYLSDTASFGLASLEIYTASFEEAFADLALEAIRSVEGVFARGGVLRDNPGAPGSRGLEISSPSDEPVPSGASMAVELLSLAYLFTGDPRYRDGALKIYSQASAHIEHAPQQLVHMLTSLDTVERPSYQVVVTGDPGGGDVGSFLRIVWRRYWPGILSASPKPPRAALLESLYRGKAWAGDPVYHICYGTACAMPARGAEEALKRFEELRRGFLGARG